MVRMDNQEHKETNKEGAESVERQMHQTNLERQDKQKQRIKNTGRGWRPPVPRLAIMLRDYRKQMTCQIM